MTDRGVSTVVGYIATLGVTAILITGLLIAGGTFVEDQRQTTVREELKVIGQRLSGDVSAADRIGHVGTDSDASIRRTLPSNVAGTPYTIRLTDSGGDPRLVLVSENPAVTVSVPIALQEGTDVVDAAIAPGDVVVEFDATPDEVTIRNA